jgi:hypothetical protein
MQIKQLILQTESPDQLTLFYKSVMDLPVQQIGTEEITVSIGSTKLVFQQAGTAGPFYHFAINIPANKIEEARTWLVSRVELLWIEQYKNDVADFTAWHAKSVYFCDPSGNIVELIARFDLDNKTEEPFSSSQFLSVSEAGLVFKEDEFDRGTESLLREYQLPYFSKQSPLPHFRAVGDDEGLFIIVPANRNWFPTDKRSGIFPITIRFENNGNSYELKV